VRTSANHATSTGSRPVAATDSPDRGSRFGKTGDTVAVTPSTESSRLFETLTVTGECDLFQAPELRQQLSELLETERPVVVDLSEASFIDSACLGVLVSTVRQAGRRGQQLFLLVSRDRTTSVRRVLDTTGLARVLPLVSSWAEIEQSLDSRHTPYPDAR